MLKSLSRILIHTVYSTKDRLFSSAIQNFGTGNTSGIDSGTDATPLGLGYRGAEFPG